MNKLSFPMAAYDCCPLRLEIQSLLPDGRFQDLRIWYYWYNCQYIWTQRLPLETRFYPSLEVVGFPREGRQMDSRRIF